MRQGSYHDPHFTGGETEVQRGDMTGQSHTLEGWEPLSTEQLTYDPGLGEHQLGNLQAAECLCKTGPGVSTVLRGGGARQGAGSPAHPGPGPSRNTHLEHNFIDGSSVRFKVEVFIVVIA